MYLLSSQTKKIHSARRPNTNIAARILRLVFVLALPACSTPYMDGKSAADVPAHINTIHLQDVYMINFSLTGSGHELNGDPSRDPAPSTNDQEVVTMAKANIVSQLTNFGYSIQEEPNAKSDIKMSFFIAYMPERWPLVDRATNILGRVYATDGTPLFQETAVKQNPIGLIGALVGPSRDEMVSDATREAVVKVVQEIRKGTKDNQPVSNEKTTPQSTPTQNEMAKK